ncbi:MAG: hypothetical protein U5N86_09210 [Planctomycetota bacterium]|nr:hypothetical protein [Planctomycetota bacterium]
MNDSLQLVFVLHNHQPVGNFDEVFTTAYERSYKPYLQIASRYEQFRFGLHISGPLFEWLEDNRREYFDQLALLVERGQVEILSGAFYEAVLTMLSDRDRRAQLELMNERIEKRFGVRPRGIWLAERVWEQCVVKDIADAGLEYTLLDDHHFKLAGIPASDLDGYFTAEDRGESISVFPISEKLRYLIPFSSPQQIAEFLAVYNGRGSLLVYGDDGEKLGLWPHTHETVYEQGWLERFFRMLHDNSAHIQLALPSEVVENTPPRGRCFLPDASYREMTEWALPVRSHNKLVNVQKKLENSGLLNEVRPFLKGHPGVTSARAIPNPPTCTPTSARCLDSSRKLSRTTRTTQPLLGPRSICFAVSATVRTGTAFSAGYTCPTFATRCIPN